MSVRESRLQGQRLSPLLRFDVPEPADDLNRTLMTDSDNSHSAGVSIGPARNGCQGRAGVFVNDVEQPDVAPAGGPACGTV
jgi:hypothetical protein